MLLLGLDFETTGLDTKTCDVIEVGAVLWDPTRRVPLAMMSEFVSGPIVPSEITEITGIHQVDLLLGQPIAAVRSSLLSLVEKANFIVAHNGTNFDRPIFERMINDKVRWIDTSVDVPYPKHMTTRKLSHLAAEHGFANPFSHRAVFDVMTMLRVLSQYDIGPIIELSALPALTVVAEVSYDDREKVKARGYRWDGAKRRWSKIMKQPQLEKEIAEAGFKVRVLENRG